MPPRGGKRPGAGAKPSVPGGRREQLVVRLHADQMTRLRAYATEHGVTPSEAVREALAALLGEVQR